ncbi:unnamed protein product [Adineta steineri]|uniref:Uncharacterized protein n=1 Tax=Adineta steineri TaxID=433720 RepID=A0A819V519_9BILA|nr:unnamed protein product [Adineta steineri]CAF4099051.1 unnamed protein product [Adineta steineri]
MIFVICQTASLYKHDDDGDTFKLNNQFRSLTRQQLAEFVELLSRKLVNEYLSAPSGEGLYRNKRRPHEHVIKKRNELWSITDLINCIRLRKSYNSSPKNDFVTEILKCFQFFN